MTTTTAPRHRGDSRPSRPSVNRVRWWTYLVLILATIVSLFPLYWMFVVATKIET